MMRILIVDDEAPARDKLRRWLSECADVAIVGEASDGMGALRALDTLAPDIVFLDIQMPAPCGLDVAAQLQATDAPLIVFVTAYDAHAVRAFDLDAIDYLLKPYDRERFERTLDRVRLRFSQVEERARGVAVARKRTGPSERLLVAEGEQLRPIEAASIQWLEASDNYVRLHTANGSHLLRRTLHDLLSQLGEQRFVRVHKSTAVNVSHVRALHPLFKGDFEIELRSGERLRMSRRYREALFAVMGG